MTAKTLMIQGTASHVGKSVLVTALCRAYMRKGIRVAPFKAQNMALNSFVTADGREMGWAQAAQAQAAGLLPQADFNPVLLKPTGDKSSQVIVHGKPLATISAWDYENRKDALWSAVQESFQRLQSRYDLIILEGAGSPAEINLKKNDIVNMRMAAFAKAPVLLVSDIDRGGVFASLVGTMSLLSPQERDLVRGLVINKFRGDVEILRPGLKMIEDRTHKPVLGVLPQFDFPYEDQEDSVALEKSSPAPNASGKIKIAVVQLPRISNFTDFDSLRMEPLVDLRFVQNASDLDSPDLIIVPGSKNSSEDLRHLQRSGWTEKIIRAARAGKLVLGICGGYQMLGQGIEDPEAVESSLRRVRGMGLLETQTIFHPGKSLDQVEYIAYSGRAIRSQHKFSGYEIHMGQTRRFGKTKPLFSVLRRSGKTVREEEGAINASGNVMGTYMHGLFNNDSYRHGLLRKIARRRGLRVFASDLLRDFEGTRQKNWDRLANWAESHLDMAAISDIIGLRL